MTSEICFENILNCTSRVLVGSAADIEHLVDSLHFNSYFRNKNYSHKYRVANLDLATGKRASGPLPLIYNLGNDLREIGARLIETSC